MLSTRLFVKANATAKTFTVVVRIKARHLFLILNITLSVLFPLVHKYVCQRNPAALKLSTLLCLKAPLKCITLKRQA